MAPGDSGFWLALVINHSLHFTSIINIPTEPESFYVNTVTCWKVTIVNLRTQQFSKLWIVISVRALFVSFPGGLRARCSEAERHDWGQVPPYRLKVPTFQVHLRTDASLSLLKLLFPRSISLFFPIIAFSRMKDFVFYFQTPVNPKIFTKQTTLLSVMTLQQKHQSPASCSDWDFVGLSTWTLKSTETRRPGGGLRGRGQYLSGGVEELISTTVSSSTHCLNVEPSRRC